MISGLQSPKDARGQSIELSGIQDLLDRIIRTWHPREIRLFGSRARGTAGPESDWDLFIVVADDEKDVDDPLAAWRVAKESRLPCDLILCRAADFEEYRSVPNTLAYEAAHGGVPIYGR